MRQSLSVLMFFIGFFLWSCGSDSDPEPVVDCNVSGPSLSLVSKADVTDCGADNGSLEVALTGGQGEIVVTINGVSSLGLVFNALSEGIYRIVALDENGCEDEIEVELQNNSSSIVLNDIQTTLSGCGSDEGSLTITASGEGTVRFALNNGTVQSDPNFTGLTAGEYLVTIFDDSECSFTTPVNIITGVSYASEIQAILTNSCNVSGCHNGDIGSSRDWTNFANVESNAIGIKSRTQSGNMPPRSSGLSLTEEEVDLIACWVDDGALNN